jgi:hypothetical protein
VREDIINAAARERMTSREAGWNLGWQPVFLVWVALLLCMACSPCKAQIVAATLSGTVTDVSGAVVPGATVIVTSVDKGTTVRTTTNSSGVYTFSALNPGTYELRAEKQGFKATVLSGITLLVDQKATIDVKLQVGQVTTLVQIRGAAPLVSATTASLGTVVGTQQMVELPLDLREVGVLALLVPGTVTDNGGFASSPLGSPFSQTTYVASGLRDSSNNTLVDGVLSRNMTFGGFALQPPPDAVQEFRVQTVIYDAAFGVAAGSTINLVTKSGTNQFHGDVYEFVRNSMFDARNFFATNQVNPVTGAEIPGTAKPEFRRNQYGFTLGGPIRKNKTFFFINYEGLRQIEGLSIGSEVPNDAEKRGDLSSFLTGTPINLCGAGGPANLNFDSGQLFSPSTETLFTCPTGSAKAGSSILVGQPIPGNVISSIDPAAAKAMAAYPEPNRPGFPNFVNQNPLVQNTSQVDARIDQNFGPKDQLFGRYLFGQSNTIDPSSASSPLPGFALREYYRGQNVVLGWTHTFSPNLLNEARIGFQRNWLASNCEACPRAPGYMESFGIKDLVPVVSGSEGFPLFVPVNFATVGDSNNQPLTSPDMIETYQDNITWVHNRHSVVAGFNLMPYQVLDMLTDGFAHGEFDYNGQYSGLAGEIPGVTGISDLADFLQGFPDNATRQVGLLPFYQVGGGFYNFYGQDDIRLKHNFTVNAGLRWEYRRPSVDKNNNLLTFVPLGPKFSGPGNAILVTPDSDAVNNSYCTNPFYSYLTTSDGRCLIASSALRDALGFTGRTQRTLLFPDYRDFAPRIGISWQPSHSGGTIVHTGYGIFYDLPIFNQQHFGVIDPVHSPTQTFTTAFGSPPVLTNGAPTTVEDVFGSGGIPPLTQQVVGLFESPYSRTPRVQEWNLDIEKQLGTNWALEVGYLGNRAGRLGDLHLLGNQPNPGVGPLQPRRPYPDLGGLLYSTFDAVSNYNALQARLTKRFSAGITLLASYTWEKALDDDEGDEGLGAGVGNLSPQNDNDLYANYAPSAFDTPQRFVASYIWDLPVGAGRHFLNRSGWVDQALGGWEFSGITSFQSGFPFSVLSNDFSNTGSSTTFPDRVCNGAGPQTVAEWFDTLCFTTALLSAALESGQPRFGNAGRNILTGPGLNSWDLALLKNFQLSERLRLQARAEFYNAFNIPYFGAPNSTITSPGFGQLDSAGTPRDLQFALKLFF